MLAARQLLSPSPGRGKKLSVRQQSSSRAQGRWQCLAHLPLPQLLPALGLGEEAWGSHSFTVLIPSDGVRRCWGVWKLAGSLPLHVARAAVLLASTVALQQWPLCPGLLQTPLLSCPPSQSEAGSSRTTPPAALVSIPVRSPGTALGSSVPLQSPEAVVLLLPCPWEPGLGLSGRQRGRPGAAPAPVRG